MGDVRASRVEIVTDDGRRAAIDDQGWHCDDSRLRARLRKEAPIAYGEADPLLATARIACDTIGGRIDSMKRKPQPRGGPIANIISRLHRALTDSALHKILIGADSLNARLESDQLSKLRRNRIISLLIWISVLGVVVACIGWMLM